MDETPPDIRKDDLLWIRETLARLEIQVHSLNLQIQELAGMASEAKAVMDSHPAVRIQKAIRRAKSAG